MIVSFRQLAIDSTSATFIALDYNSSIVTVTSLIDFIVTMPSGAFGISGLASNGNVPSGSIARVTSCQFLGGGTDLENITPDDFRWSFIANSPTRDSQADALLSFKANATATVISASSTDGSNAVLVAGTWTCQRQSHFSCTTAGRVTYDGERNLITPIDVVATLDASADDDLAIYISLNGSAISATGLVQFVKSTQEETLSTLWQLELSTTNFIEIFVENQTGTSNITVQDIIFRVR